MHISEMELQYSQMGNLRFVVFSEVPIKITFDKEVNCKDTNVSVDFYKIQDNSSKWIIVRSVIESKDIYKVFVNGNSVNIVPEEFKYAIKKKYPCLKKFLNMNKNQNEKGVFVIDNGFRFGYS